MALNLQNNVPMDIGAEQATIGSVLSDPTRLTEVLRVVPVENSSWFLEPRHKALFEHTVILANQKAKPVDFIVLRDHLLNKGMLEEVGGEEYMIELCESFGDSANAKHYAAIVREKGILRDLLRAGERLYNCATSPLATSSELLEDLDRMLNSARMDRKRSEPEGMASLLAKLRESMAVGAPRERGAPTGFPTLDRATGGLQRGEVTIIAARPSIGKTGLGASIAMNAWGAGRVVLFESLEMDRLSVAARMVCSTAGIDTRRVRDRKLDGNEQHKFASAIDRLSNSDGLYINDVPGMTLSELRADVRAEVSRHNVDLVVIDYLGLVRLGWKVRAENRNVEVSELSAGIKNIAREFSIPVILLAQLNRQAVYDGDNGPELHHLRDSGSIEQDADVVLMLWRKDEGVVDMDAINAAHEHTQRTGQPVELHREVHAAIRKNRNGPLAKFIIRAEYQYSRYIEQAQSEPVGIYA